MHFYFIIQSTPKTKLADDIAREENVRKSFILENP